MAVDYTNITLVTLLMIAFVEGAIIVINRHTIINKMKMTLGKNAGYGKVKILKNNGTIDESVHKLSIDGFKIDECQYRFDTKRVYRESDDSRAIYYRVGDAEPIDLEQKDIPVIDGKLYATALVKAMAAGAMSVTNEERFALKDMAIFAGAGASILTAYLMFKHVGI